MHQVSWAPEKNVLLLSIIRQDKNKREPKREKTDHRGMGILGTIDEVETTCEKRGKTVSEEAGATRASPPKEFFFF
jgi:hypothetical protein